MRGPVLARKPENKAARTGFSVEVAIMEELRAGYKPLIKLGPDGSAAEPHKRPDEQSKNRVRALDRSPAVTMDPS